MEDLRVLKINVAQTITAEDVQAWLKVIAFTKQNKFGILEIPINNGKPQIGKWQPTIDFKNV